MLIGYGALTGVLLALCMKPAKRSYAEE